MPLAFTVVLIWPIALVFLALVEWSDRRELDREWLNDLGIVA